MWLLHHKEGRRKSSLVFKNHKTTSPFNMLDCQELNFEAKERNPEKFIYGFYSGLTVESPINSGNYKA